MAKSKSTTKSKSKNKTSNKKNKTSTPLDPETTSNSSNTNINTGQGSKTLGTNIGNVKELSPAELPAAKQLEKKIILDDPALMEAAKLGSAALIEEIKLKDPTLLDKLDLDEATVADFAEGKFTGIDTERSDQFRSRQLDFADQLNKQIKGEGPSLASLQLKESTDRGIAQQKALAASRRGVAGGLGDRQAAMNVAAIQQSAASEAAKQRVQEQFNAQNLLGMNLMYGRQADTQVEIANAENQNRLSLAEMQEKNATARFNAGQINQQQYNQALLDAEIMKSNQAAQNQFALTQGQIDLDRGKYNAGFQNEFAMKQAELENAARAANVEAKNLQSYNQAQLDFNVGSTNARFLNDFAQAQANLNQQAGQYNVEAFNTNQRAQAQINSQLEQQRIAAAATTSAAAAGASASKYGSDTAAFVAALNAMKGENSGAFNASTGTTEGNFNATTSNEANKGKTSYIDNSTINTISPPKSASAPKIKQSLRQGRRNR